MHTPRALASNTALLVIDMQLGFDDPAWGPRNNPMAESNVAVLLQAWRMAKAPVIHVHHDSPGADGRFRPGTPGNLPKVATQPREDEMLYRKSVNSAFIGTELEADLRAIGVQSVVIVGLSTNHCISTSARMASNLGFDTFVVSDATATFDRANLDGTMRRAEEVHQAALSDLQDEFAEIVDTNWLLGNFAANVAFLPHTRMLRAFAGGLLALGLFTAMPLATAQAVGAIDIAAVDATVKPGDDFYAYANNTWIRATPAPTGMVRVDTTSLLRAETAQRVQDLLDGAVVDTAGAGPAIARKVADYYATRLDRAAIEAKGFAPLARDLAAIAAIENRSALAAQLGRVTRLDDGSNTKTESLFGIWIHQGFHDADRYAVHMVQGGLGLFDREPYLDPAPDKATQVVCYKAYIADVLRAAGFDNAEQRAANVLELEVAIAKTHASRADTDDVQKTDNNWRGSDFAAKAPGMDWAAYFAAAGLGLNNNFVVWQPGAVTGSAKLVETVSLDSWKDYLAFHLVEHYAAVLPNAVAEARRICDQRLGTKMPPPDVKQLAIQATQDAMGDAIGQLYVARYVPAGTKTAATEMADNLRAAMRTHLQQLRWLTPAAKEKALQKLAALQLSLVHPERWVDYGDLEVVRGDAFGNLQRAERFAYKRALARLGHPVDPNEWPEGLYPQNVGAILDISPNAMQFAAVLQPPFFDAAGDVATNYGSAGAGMAHEISHTFDEVTNLFDEKGRLGAWWSKEDEARFAAATAPLAAQLDACEPAPGVKVVGKKVLGESFADLIGLHVAFDAYQKVMKGKKDEVKNGLTGEQRFFVAFAQRWRRVQTDEALAAQVKTDTHAPPSCRANLVRNSDAWVKAFGVKVGDRLWVGVGERVAVRG